MSMNANAMATDASEIIDLEVIAGTSPTTAKESAEEEADSYRLPFGFASAQGVMLSDPDSKIVLHRPGITLDVMLELQRYLGDGFTLEEIPADDFQKRLTKDYQSGDGAAQRAAEDLGNEFDLSSMA